ncbi:hypothetical protein FIBSPDRAFT_156886 [Athelia psychrophila]|uniref:Uncharacterized protein n=1 Tax=Athelia psychrophila TaxID=1759441 RepID=A0A166B9C5_9AGAM|nr:hypothetical protein FIBSPDRAFT_156886 [Fibularhizoctonia sp. CBS 109695]
MADVYALVPSSDHLKDADEEPFLPEEERTLPLHRTQDDYSPWTYWLTVGLSSIALLSTILLHASFPSIESVSLADLRSLASLRSLAPYPNLETLSSIRKAKGSMSQKCVDARCIWLKMTCRTRCMVSRLHRTRRCGRAREGIHQQQRCGTWSIC